MKANVVDLFYNVGTGKRTSLKGLRKSGWVDRRIQSTHQIRAPQPGDVGAQPNWFAGARQKRDLGFECANRA